MDLSKTIEAKTDHLTADDLIGGTKTITITKVSVRDTDRPLVIEYAGGNGKPYLPCKSMIRVMCAVWGKDGNNFVGQSLTLFRDPTVVFGGQKLGGVRISHITGIAEPLTLMLTATRGKKSPYKVEPLILASAKPETPIDDIYQEITQAQTLDVLKVIFSKYQKHKDFDSIKTALSARKENLQKSTETVGEQAQVINDALYGGKE